MAAIETPPTFLAPEGLEARLRALWESVAGGAGDYDPRTLDAHFAPLSRGSAGRILEHEIARIAERYATLHGVDLRVTVDREGDRFAYRVEET